MKNAKLYHLNIKTVHSTMRKSWLIIHAITMKWETFKSKMHSKLKIVGNKMNTCGSLWNEKHSDLKGEITSLWSDPGKIVVHKRNVDIQGWMHEPATCSVFSTYWVFDLRKCIHPFFPKKNQFSTNRSDLKSIKLENRRLKINRFRSQWIWNARI